ncbi:MAG: tetratricopeptide repeat protein [Alphaproteobacteria bacterium]|nr:tetratricopeptide repeat protein [Alphaproteobacteria bacterium]
MSLDILFAEALRLHREQHFAEAEANYRKILALQPNHIDAKQLLGSILIDQATHRAQGIQLIEAALAQLGMALPYAQPQNQPKPPPMPPVAAVPALVNLGNGWQKFGDLTRAESCYRAALTAKPELAEIWNNLGNILSQLARLSDNNSDDPRQRPELLREAEQSYQHSLSLAAHAPQTLANLAHFYLKAGRYEASLPWFERLLTIAPDRSDYRLAYWEALRQLGRQEQFRQNIAARIFQEGNAAYFALYADLLISDGLALSTVETEQPSAQCFTDALAMATRAACLELSADHLALIGRCYALMQQPALAEQAWREAEILAAHSADANSAEKTTSKPEPDPRFADIIWRRQKGQAFEQLRHWDDAKSFYRSSLAHLGDLPVDAVLPREVASELAVRLATLEAISFNPIAAEHYFRQALAWNQSGNATHLAALVGLANACHHNGRSDEAIIWLKRAQNLAPHRLEILFNRANITQDQGDLPRAISIFEEILAHRPDYLDAEWNLSHAQLSYGDFINGFRHFEVRFRRQNSYVARRNFSPPAWEKSSNLAGKTLLVHSEQGLGDTLQFCRLVPMLLDLPTPPRHIFFEVQRPMVGLMQNSFSDLSDRITIIPRSPNFPGGAELPDFDLHVALMSLPYMLELTPATIPSKMPYLRAEPAHIKFWRERLDGLIAEKNPTHAAKMPRIGLVWAGECRRDIPLAVETDRQRSIALSEFEAFIAEAVARDYAIISLQKGAPQAQLRQNPFKDAGLNHAIIDVMDEIDGFDQTAALLATLDGVVTVDTSVAHLAGGMNCPTWLLSRKNGCWRWLAGQSQSPWYPRMTVFHQQKTMAWQDEIAQIAAVIFRKV